VFASFGEKVSRLHGFGGLWSGVSGSFGVLWYNRFNEVAMVSLGSEQKRIIMM